MNELRAQPLRNEQQQNLTLLKVYTFYRTVLACALLLSFSITQKPFLAGHLKPVLFTYTTSVYLAINLIVLFIILPRTTQLSDRQLFFNFVFDIAAITLIADSTGGANSGLGILLIVSVAASSILLSHQLPTLIAALASIALIADTGYLISQGYLDISSFLSVGLLGVILFITSFFIQSLAQRIHRVQQIAEQNQAKINTLQQFNQLVVQRMRTGILITNRDGEIQMSNEAAAELLGIVDQGTATNSSTRHLLPDELQQQFKQWLSAPQFHTPPFRTSPTGPQLQASFSLLNEEQENNVLIFLEDNRYLAQRAQQMKLASLGRLTASIAHEIRNPLSAINHAAQLLEESPKADSHDQRLCEIIQHHSKRMNKIVENVLQLSQRHAPNPERIQLYHWLQAFIQDFKSNGYSDSHIDLHTTSPHNEVTVDVSQLAQVLTNLIQNGLRHSQQATGKATVTIDFHVNRSTHLPVLDIIDDGPGIPEENKDNIFEPFYTTETTGTGLGLYISRELCEANQARLDYLRLEQNKSCFRISFPHPDRRLSPD